MINHPFLAVFLFINLAFKERRRRNLREPVPHYSNVYRTLDDFPEPEAEQLRAEFESEVQGRTLDELRDLWLQIHDDLLQKYTLLVEEHEKYQRYQVRVLPNPFVILVFLPLLIYVSLRATT